MDHYFIGKALNPDDARQLVGKRDYISRQITSTGKVYDFNTKFAYLGYMDKATALMIKDKLNNIFEALSNKYGPLTCKYKKYDITGIRTSKKSISIVYENKEVSEVIVPYIRNFVDDILQIEPSYFVPHVSLVRFDISQESKILREDNKGKNILEKTFMPKKETFTLDSIDLMKGVLKIKRQGAPSKYDDMNIEVIDRFMLNGTHTGC